MIEQDTIRLLRECDAGAQMGVDALEDVLTYVQTKDLHTLLGSCRAAHESLSAEIRLQLDRFGDDGKDPNRIAESMSKMKTNVKMTLDRTDAAAAELITDGCNMGVKSLSRYLNQYAAADETSKDIAKRLIRLEENLAADLRAYL